MNGNIVTKIIFFVAIGAWLSNANAQDTGRFQELMAEITRLSKTKDYAATAKAQEALVAWYDTTITSWSSIGVPDSIIDGMRKQRKQTSDMVVFYRLQDEVSGYNAIKDYERSNECYERMITHLDTMGWHTLIPKVKSLMSSNYNSMGMPYLQAGQFDEAKPYFEKALELETPTTKGYRSAARWMGNLYDLKAGAIMHTHEGVSLALAWFRKAEEYYQLDGGMRNILKMRLEQAECMQMLGRTAEAEKVYKEIIELASGADSLDAIRGRVLNNLGDIELLQEQFHLAAEYFEQGYMLLINCNQPAMSPAQALYNLYTFHIPEPAKATLWEQRAKVQRDFFEKSKTPSRHKWALGVEEYVNTFGRITEAMQIINHGDVLQGIIQLTNIIEECENAENFPIPLLATCYRFRASGYIHEEDYTKAEQDNEKCIDLLYKTRAEGVEDLTPSWYQLAAIYYKQDKRQDAMRAADSCVAASMRYYGQWHTETEDAYNMRANLAATYGDTILALGDLHRCFDIIRHNVGINFAYLTADERFSYWEKHRKHTTNMFAFAQKLNEVQGTFIDDLYDQQLLAKGLMLSTESALQRIIDSDSTLGVLYNRIASLRKKIYLENLTDNESVRLSAEADQMERQMVTKAGTLSSLLDFMKVRWSDVQGRLKTDEAAVEFVDYRIGKDSTMYAALVIVPKWQHVKFIPLIEQRELPAVNSINGEKIWRNVFDAIGGDVKRVYFAASGKLYQLPIENMELSDGKMAHEEKQLYRVSSTRELVFRHGKIEIKRGAVYGGLDYDAKSATLQIDTTRYSHYDSPSSREGVSLFSSRHGYLKGTLEEAQLIDSIMQSVQITSTLYSDTIGTEASFKALSGKHINLLHLGTHGEYVTSKNTQDGQLSNRMGLDMALERTALFFAGANLASQNHTSVGAEDGILTADEVAALDFNDMSLVVLSACVSGMGDVSSDGVFGLQRGFKKAGANSIIMTLWSVDDLATRMLMAQFYENMLIKKMTKQKALKAAQEYVRNFEVDETEWTLVLRKYRGSEGSLWRKAIVSKNRGSSGTNRIIKPYQDPIYWAAFILLDGLD